MCHNPSYNPAMLKVGVMILSATYRFRVAMAPCIINCKMAQNIPKVTSIDITVDDNNARIVPAVRLSVLPSSVAKWQLVAA